MNKIDNAKFTGILQKVEMRKIIGGGTGLQTEGCQWTNSAVDVKTGAITWTPDSYGDYYADPCEE